MRYVTMVVTVVMLIAGSITFAAQAAEDGGEKEVNIRITSGMKLKTSSDPEAILASVQGISPGDSAARRLDELKAAKAAAEAEAARLAREEQARQEKAARDAGAVARFGNWGPWLVEAGATYGQDPAELYRVMQCESTGNPMADNGTHKGLFQFHPGTWAGTPYGGADIHDGPSQIMAAAWMWSQGRQNEWTCY